MTTFRSTFHPFAWLLPLALLVCGLAVAQESYEPAERYGSSESYGPDESYGSSESYEPAERYSSSESYDQPERVARLSYANGEVSLQPADTNEWTAAVLNRPLTSGDTLWVGEDSRAELQIGSASIHLDRNNGFSFLYLDDHTIDMN